VDPCVASVKLEDPSSNFAKPIDKTRPKLVICRNFQPPNRQLNTAKQIVGIFVIEDSAAKLLPSRPISAEQSSARKILPRHELGCINTGLDR
jgi:hypothetical protein